MLPALLTTALTAAAGIAAGTATLRLVLRTEEV